MTTGQHGVIGGSMVGRLHIPYAAINETSNPHDCLIKQHLPASFPSHNPEFSRKITINYCNRSRSDDRADWKSAPQGIPTLWAMSKPRGRGNFSGYGRNNAKSEANHAVWFRRSGVLLRYVPPPAKPAAMCRVPARPCGQEKLPHRTAIIPARRHDRERLQKW